MTAWANRVLKPNTKVILCILIGMWWLSIPAGCGLSRTRRGGARTEWIKDISIVKPELFVEMRACIGPTASYRRHCGQLLGLVTVLAMTTYKGLANRLPNLQSM